jgi:hypothetical protein
MAAEMSGECQEAEPIVDWASQIIGVLEVAHQSQSYDAIMEACESCDEITTSSAATRY